MLTDYELNIARLINLAVFLFTFGFVLFSAISQSFYLKNGVNSKPYNISRSVQTLWDFLIMLCATILIIVTIRRL